MPMCRLSAVIGDAGVVPASTGQLREGFIRALDVLAPYVGDLGSVFWAEIHLLAGAGHVVRAVDDRLHPPQACVPGRADLFLCEARRRGQRDERVAALVQIEPPGPRASPYRLALVGNVHVELAVVAGPPATWTTSTWTFRTRA